MIMANAPRGTTRAHFCRAAIEAMAYQSLDVYDALRADVAAAKAGFQFGDLRVDGGGLLTRYWIGVERGWHLSRPVVGQREEMGLADGKL